MFRRRGVRLSALLVGSTPTTTKRFHAVKTFRRHGFKKRSTVAALENVLTSWGYVPNTHHDETKTTTERF